MGELTDGPDGGDREERFRESQRVLRILEKAFRDGEVVGLAGDVEAGLEFQLGDGETAILVGVDPDPGVGGQKLQLTIESKE